MKGFVISLIPTDTSGVQRNRDFFGRMNGKMAGGGVLQLEESGLLKVVYAFNADVPETAKNDVLIQLTGSLEDAKNRKDNFTFKVEKSE